MFSDNDFHPFKTVVNLTFNRKGILPSFVYKIIKIDLET